MACMVKPIANRAKPCLVRMVEIGLSGGNAQTKGIRISN